MGALTLDRLFVAAGGLVLLVGWGVWWASEVDRGAGVLAPMLGTWLATGAIAFGAWWRRREPELRPLPSAAGLAMATPLALSGIAFSGPGGTIIAAAATVLAILPVTILLSERLARGGPTDRVGRRVAIGAVMLDFLLVPALGLGWSGGSRPEGLSEMYWLLLAVAILTPSVLDVTAALERSGSTTTAPDRRALRDLATALGVAVATLSIVVEVWPILVVPVLSIMLTAGFLVGYAIAPLERVAGSFREQRDLVVTVLEFERGRVAEAIHDGPLADLALLVQRLDRDGDPEVAALGRTISAELRSISHELRVPLLEDLGAGAAIEWLAERIGERTRVAIAAELATTARPPAPVELAFFRIAQEAIMNAVRHGAGPIHVRYAADRRSAALSVSDAGGGLDESAQARSLADGHLGLLLMNQRAEAIGATFSLESVSGGGTRVELEWEAA